MKRSTFSAQQIARALRLAESGTPVLWVCGQISVSEAKYDIWTLDKEGQHPADWPVKECVSYRLGEFDQKHAER